MNKALGAILALAAGIGVGGASAYGVTAYAGDGNAWGSRTPALTFAPIGTMVAPLVFADGRLAAYISFDAQLEVDRKQKDLIDARLPVLMHAVNMRSYRTPLAAGVDGLIPELEGLRKMVEEAAKETYGAGVIHRVIVTQASPT